MTPVDALAIGEALRLEIEGERFTIRREADGFCTCVPKTCAFLWINASGAEIMTLLANGLNRAAIVDRMSDATQLSQSFWSEAVDEFIEYLVANAVLSRGGLIATERRTE